MGMLLPFFVQFLYADVFGNRWMAARSDLEDERVKSEYERGYKTLIEFFGKHLK